MNESTNHISKKKQTPVTQLTKKWISEDIRSPSIFFFTPSNFIKKFHILEFASQLPAPITVLVSSRLVTFVTLHIME